MRKLIFFLFFLALSSNSVFAQQYDLVLEGGRVMDPETGLDAERTVGIRDGKRGGNRGSRKERENDGEEGGVPYSTIAKWASPKRRISLSTFCLTT